MRVLSKKEWIAIASAIVIVVLFLGARFVADFSNNNSTAAVSEATQKTADDTSSNINNDDNNNMNQNNSSTTPDVTSLVIKDTVMGTGAQAEVGDLVTVNYTGKFADGKVFDSSIPRGQPFPFTLGIGQVIKGWDQGVAGMKVGGKRTLIIPSSLGYGAAGFPPVIPPNSTLYFDVELVGVQKQ